MYQEVACTLYPVSPMITSCITLVQYQSQEIDIIHRSYLGFASFICTCVFMQFFVHVFLSCIGGFVLCVMVSLPSLFVEFIHAPMYTTSSLFLPLKRILLCTSLLCTYFPTVDSQLASFSLPTSTDSTSVKSHSHVLVDLCASDIQAGIGLLGYLFTWLCEMSA